MRTRIFGACLLTLGVLAGAAWAADDELDEDDPLYDEIRPVHCVNLRQIDRTKVVDDKNILFYMKDDRIYRNRLPHRCAGLGFEESFMYRSTLNQLCDVDIITVLDDIGFGFRSGISCGLGMFYPIDEDMADDLLEKDE